MLRLSITKAATLAMLFSSVLLVFRPSSGLAQEEEAADAVIDMIVDLVGNADRDMRALGLQQLREAVPGEAATKKFVALLPKLPPDQQADLVGALGDRGDLAARPGVLNMVDNKEEKVRAAALGALGVLGGAADVPLLGKKAAAGSDSERGAARQSLIRLKGDDVNAAILSALAAGEPAVRVELLGVLGARNAKEAFPTILESAQDSDTQVRLAAIGAIRFLADQKDAAEIVKIIKAAKDDAERRKAELALLVVCGRGRQECADAVIDGMADADAASRVALLHALARAGGEKALAGVVARLDDGDEAVRDEAVRMLSIWSEPAAAPHLLNIAKTAESTRYRVLALRGLVRLASPEEDKAADVKTLAEVMSLAKRAREKQLVLGALVGAKTQEALDLAAAALKDAGLAEEAGLASVAIAEKIENGESGKIRPVMEAVLKTAKSQETRKRAQKVLASL